MPTFTAASSVLPISAALGRWKTFYGRRTEFGRFNLRPHHRRQEIWHEAVVPRRSTGAEP